MHGRGRRPKREASYEIDGKISENSRQDRPLRRQLWHMKTDPTLLAVIDVPAPNESEAMVLAEQRTSGVLNPDRAADALLEEGARSVLITLGADGVLYRDGGDAAAARSIRDVGDRYIRRSRCGHRGVRRGARFNHAARACGRHRAACGVDQCDASEGDGFVGLCARAVRDRGL
jgi:hypothetical protein